MNRLILPLVALMASSSLAFAQPVKMTDTQLDGVVAGHTDVNCSEHICGNNGWGNGTDIGVWSDGRNPGSDNGGTAESKFSNGLVGLANPSNSPNSDGR